MENVLEQSLKSSLQFFRDFYFMERFTDIDALIQKVDPRIKFLSFLSFILVAVTAKNLLTPLLLLSLSVILASLSKIPLRFYILRVWFFIPVYAAVIMLPIPFITPGTPIAIAKLAFLSLTITWEGVRLAIAFVLRVSASVSFASLLILTTNFPKLMKAIERLGIPNIFVAMACITFRYIFFFVDMLYRMLLARESRMASGESFTQACRGAAANVGALFIRAYEKSEKVYFAMLSRGYTGEIRLLSEMRCKRKDYIFAAFSILFCVMILILEFSLLGGL